MTNNVYEWNKPHKVNYAFSAMLSSNICVSTVSYQLNFYLLVDTKENFACNLNKCENKDLNKTKLVYFMHFDFIVYYKQKCFGLQLWLCLHVIGCQSVVWQLIYWLFFSTLTELVYKLYKSYSTMIKWCYCVLGTLEGWWSLTKKHFGFVV